MWRVVLLTFVHCNHNASWRNEMIRFSHAKPMDDGPDAIHKRDVFAFDIVREALRLYPSSKRVYRMFSFQRYNDDGNDKEDCGDGIVYDHETDDGCEVYDYSRNNSGYDDDEEDDAVDYGNSDDDDDDDNGNGLEEVSANIEACHRDLTAFGPDPLRFRPERWAAPHRPNGRGVSNRDYRMDQGFLPFGAYPFLCPARRDFALRFVAVLVGAMCRAVDPLQWQTAMGSGEIQALCEDWALPSGRWDAEGWVMRKKGGAAS
jgi:hypothetical protein